MTAGDGLRVSYLLSSSSSLISKSRQLLSFGFQSYVSLISLFSFTISRASHSEYQILDFLLSGFHSRFEQLQEKNIGCLNFSRKFVESGMEG